MIKKTLSFSICLIFMLWKCVESRSLLKDPLRISNVRDYHNPLQDHIIPINLHKEASSDSNPSVVPEAVSGPPMIYQEIESDGLADEGAPTGSALDVIGTVNSAENLRTTSSREAISGPPVVFPEDREDHSADAGAPVGSRLDVVGRVATIKDIKSTTI
jgi:hypothetical protein